MTTAIIGTDNIDDILPTFIPPTASPICKPIRDFAQMIRQKCLNPSETTLDQQVIKSLTGLHEKCDTAVEFETSLLNYKSMFQRIEDAIDIIDEIYSECSDDNWDGYGALAINENVYIEARDLLKILPNSIPMPDIAPEPDGGIGFEWYCGAGSSFVISVDGNNRLSYAGLFGDNNEVHGTENLTDVIPDIIKTCIRRLYY